MKNLILLFFSTVFCCKVWSQVNIQTGSATYDIPIFNYSDKKGVSTSVSISYSSGTGFKPGELASNVGTGWALLAGGFIQRIQAGEPDDQDSRQTYPASGCNGAAFSTQNCYNYHAANPYNYNYIRDYYPNGYLYSEYDNAESASGSQDCQPNELMYDPRFNNIVNTLYDGKPWKMSRRALADRQQDRFLFNMNGRVGEFLIGKETNGIKKILLPNGAKLKVDYDDSQDLSYLNIRTRIKSFKITDENGIIYKFNDYTLTHVMEYGVDTDFGYGSSPQTSTMFIIPNSIPGQPSTFQICYANCSSQNYPTIYKTTPLPSVRLNPFAINKWYLSEIYNPLTKVSIFFQYDTKPQDNIIARSVDFTGRTNFTEEREVVKNKILKKILLPDGHEVRFLYSSILRRDYLGNEPLTKIEILYNGNIIDSHELNYGYFFKNNIVPYNTGASYSGNDIRYLRLCLQSIQKKTPSLFLPPYTFQYYTGQEGGYSGTYTSVAPVHSFLVDYWGYRISMVEEPSDPYTYISSNSNTLRDGVNGKVAQIGLIKEVRNPYGGSIKYSYEESFAKDKFGVVKPSGGVKVSQTTLNSEETNNQPVTTSYKYILGDGSSSGWGYESPNTTETKRVIYFYDNQNDYVHSVKPVAQILFSPLDNLIRSQIESLISSGVSAAFQIIGCSSLLSNTILLKAIVEKVYSIFFGSIIGSDVGSWLGITNTPTQEKTYTVSSYFPLSQRNPIGIHYSRVEVKNETFNSGKIIYTYSRPSSDLHEILPFTSSPEPRFKSFKFNNLLSVQYINATGDLVKQIDNEYNFTNDSPITDQSYLSCYTNVTKTYSAPNNNFNYVGSGVANYYYFYPQTGNANLIKQINRDYINNIVVNTEEVTFTYDPATLLLKETETLNAKGEKVGNTKYYASDFPTIPVLQELVDTYNVYNAEVSEVTWMEKQPGAGKVLVGVTHTEFTNVNGHIKPTQEYKSELSAPIISPLTTNPIDPAAPLAVSFIKSQGTIQYDNDGNAVEVTSPTGKKNATLYDYSGRYVVATIANAEEKYCAYTSFEGNNHNHFQIANAGIISEKGITGTKCYDAFYNINYSVPSPVPANPEKKILSFWWYGQAPAIGLSSGTLTLKEQSAPILGWVFYLYEVPANVTNFTIGSSAANTSYVDEVRCYPISARMATTTYNLPYGKSSVCNASNRLAYFEYDEFGRISKELDENRNVLKTYEYKFKTP